VLTVDGDQVRARAVSAYPRGLAVGGDGTVVVAGWGTGSVEVLPPGGASRRRELCDQPEAVAVSPDGRLAVVVPLVPQGAATDPDQAIAVRVVDLASLEGTSVPLPAGSTLGREVAITPDGRWACVTHVIGKAAMPNTRIDRGWVSTNALSIIDLQARTRLGSVLLDRLERGAAEPWGIAFLRATRPHTSPYLEADGQLSPAAQRGRAIFAGRGECAECHAGPWGSDQAMHDVGTISNPLDRGKKVVTPMLVELWATAPYLHDGSAARLEDVVRQAAETGRHGAVRALSASERADLVGYLLSR
jgi:hypothetical protein